MKASSRSRERTKRPQGLKRPRLRRIRGKAVIVPTSRAKSSISTAKRASRSLSWTPKTARMITPSVIRCVCGRSANGIVERPARHLLAGEGDDQLAVALDSLAVEGRQQELALAHVRGVVEGEDRVRAERRLQHRRVRLAGVEDRGRAGEDLFDQVGPGDVDDAAEAGEADREEVAVAALVGGEEAERVAQVAQRLDQRRRVRSRWRGVTRDARGGALREGRLLHSM